MFSASAFSQQMLWTPVKGYFDFQQNSIYGSQGSAASANRPGLRYGSTAWTWVKGSETDGQPGRCGTLGVRAPANTPGARDGAAAFMTGDRLYLFGGYGYDTGGMLTNVGDLWFCELIRNSAREWALYR